MFLKIYLHLVTIINISAPEWRKEKYDINRDTCKQVEKKSFHVLRD